MSFERSLVASTGATLPSKAYYNSNITNIT